MEIQKERSSALIREAEVNGMKPESVFGPYLFDGELCVLFGDENTGKSILAHDIAIFCSGGNSYWPTEFKPATHTPAMYVDLEMTDKQYSMRYKGASAYITNDLVRARLDITGGSSEEIIQAIIGEIIKTQNRPDPIKLLILDNLSYAMDSLHSAKEMKLLIRSLKELIKRFDITIILVAHCIKRKRGEPIVSNDLGGSKVIMNFVDSAMAIGTSKIGDDIKYLKQIKSRMAPKMKEVRTLEICKKPYLHIKPLDLVKEEDHLTGTYADAYMRKIITPRMEPVIFEMRELGKSYEEIADYLNITTSAVDIYCHHKGI